MKEGKDFSPRRGKVITTREEDNANTITAAQGIEQCIVIQKTANNCTTLKTEETGTIQAGGQSRMDKIPNIILDLEKWSIRRLTEIECERLQGFTDNWTAKGKYPAKKISQKKFNALSNEEKIKIFEGGY